MSFKDAVTSSVAGDTLTGRVKWFNNKAGYGFITVTDGSRSGSDIFVHHSGINVENQQYKYLIQGEYVDFFLEKAESGSHEYYASSVHGVKGGKLMCETRRDFKLARSVYKITKPSSSTSTTDSNIDESKTPRQSRVPRQTAPRSRGEGPRESESDKKEWTTVTRSKPDEKQTEKQPVRTRGRPPRGAVSNK
jgi:CspA family cold shock protein